MPDIRRKILIEQLVNFLLELPDPLRELDLKEPGVVHELEGRLLAKLLGRNGHSWEAVARACGRKTGSSIQRAVARHPELSGKRRGS
jgi:hypothetical protein